jgi:hypothetical protein
MLMAVAAAHLVSVSRRRRSDPTLAR